MRWRVRMKSKMRTMSLAAAAALCATVGFADVTFGGKWYEAAADKYGVTLVGWKQFYMGANIAIPVTVTDANGESIALTSADVTIKPGTYIDYGTPRIVSEAKMWAKYGQPIQDVFSAGSRIDLEKDGGVWVYNNWDWEDVAGVTYELEKGIWPFFGEGGRDPLDVAEWVASSRRQWILIPTGKRPQKGTHTFTVRVKSGGKTASFAVSFTMTPDQKAKAATVRFNANGGKVSEYGRVVSLNKSIGALPKPKRSGCWTFNGWYTAKTKGKKVTASTKVTKAMALYAQWLPLSLNASRKYRLSVGVKTSLTSLGIAAVSGWKIKSFTGIPGLKWNASKQKMTGMPSKKGTYTVTIKVAKGSTTYTVKVKVVVKGLPKNVVGTFYGFTTSEYDMDETSAYYDSLQDYLAMRCPRFGWSSENVKVSVTSAGRISAKVGEVSFSGTGLTHLSNSVYKVSMKKSEKIASGMFKGCVQSWSCEFEIDGSAAWNRAQLKGVYWYLGHPCAESMGGPQCMVASKNRSATDKKAKGIAAKCAKHGKQSFCVVKARSGSDYAYALECPECFDPGDTNAKKTLFVKVEKDGKATLSGKIGGTAVSGTTYLAYESDDCLDQYAHARFFSGRFVIAIYGNVRDGALYGGAVWKK